MTCFRIVSWEQGDLPSNFTVSHGFHMVKGITNSTQKGQAQMMQTSLNTLVKHCDKIFDENTKTVNGLNPGVIS